MNRLLLLLLLLPSLAWATTYYVDSTAATGGDGSESTPWDQISDITGLSANDTICLSGTFDETLTPATTGTSGNPVTYDFECDGKDVGYIARTGNNNGVTITAAIEYITLQDPHISAGARCVSMDQTTDTTQGHHRINDGTIGPCSTHASAGTDPGIYMATHDFILDGTVMSGMGDDAARAPANVGDLTFQNCSISDVSNRTATGDVIQVGTSGGAGNLTVDACTISYDGTDKQALIDSGTGTLIVRNSTFDGGDVGVKAFSTLKPSGSCLIQRNTFKNFATYTLFADTAAVGCTVESTIFQDTANAIYLSASATGTWNAYNNSAERVDSFMFSLGTQTVNATNNIVDCNSGSACMREVAGTTYTGVTNQFAREYTAMFIATGVNKDTLATWASAVSSDTTSSVGAAGYSGGESPTTDQGYRLAAGSANRATCTDLGSRQDRGNRRFKFPPSCGAWEAASGDAAAARTAR